MRYTERLLKLSVDEREAIILLLQDYKQRCLEQAVIGNETPGETLKLIIGTAVNKTKWLKEVAEELEKIDRLLAKI